MSLDVSVFQLTGVTHSSLVHGPRSDLWGWWRVFDPGLRAAATTATPSTTVPVSGPAPCPAPCRKDHQPQGFDDLCVFGRWKLARCGQPDGRTDSKTGCQESKTRQTGVASREKGNKNARNCFGFVLQAAQIQRTAPVFWFDRFDMIVKNSFFSFSVDKLHDRSSFIAWTMHSYRAAHFHNPHWSPKMSEWAMV